MKRTDIIGTEEAIIQSLIDVGFKLEGDGPTLQEYMDTKGKRLRMLDELYDIVTEIDARETGSNCVIPQLQEVGWDELFDRGIEVLKQLKEVGDNDLQ